MVNLSKSQKLIFIIFLLAAIGILMVYSSSYPYALDIGEKSNHFVKNHLIYTLIGLTLCVIASFIPYQVYKKLSVLIFILAFILCLLVFTPLGRDYDTFARRWLEIGPIPSFMPSDLMKIASIVLMATYLSMKKSKKLNFIQDLFPVLGIIGISILPIYLQPNFSTVLLLIIVLLAMYFVNGARLFNLLSMFFLGIIAVIFALFSPGNEYRLRRIRILLNPLEDFYDAGWQLSQSLFAVASGGVLGVGIGKSSQKYLYLSEAHNDFIFAIIAEETGFLGSLLVILLFLRFIKVGLEISADTKDSFGKLLAFGLTMMIGVQAFINMGVAFGLVPPTGLVLPLISYGGSSLIITYIMIGILINICRNNTKKVGGRWKL